MIRELNPRAFGLFSRLYYLYVTESDFKHVGFKKLPNRVAHDAMIPAPGEVTYSVSAFIPLDLEWLNQACCRLPAGGA